MSEAKVGISIGTVTGGQNNIGETNIAGDQVMNINASTVVTASQFVAMLKDLIEKETPTPATEESIAALEEVAEQPQPEPKKVDSVVNQFRQVVAERGPQFGLKLCRGVIAGLQAGAVSHPLVSSILAFLKTFAED